MTTQRTRGAHSKFTVGRFCKKPILKITALKAIETIKPVAMKGSLEIVKRLCQRLSEGMTFATNSVLIAANPFARNIRRSGELRCAPTPATPSGVQARRALSGGVHGRARGGGGAACALARRMPDLRLLGDDARVTRLFSGAARTPPVSSRRARRRARTDQLAVGSVTTMNSA